MNCRTARRRLVAHIDDELAPGETIQVQRHLERCEQCAAEHAMLLAELPIAPVVRLDAHARHAMHRAVDDAVDRAETVAVAPSSRLGMLRRALGDEVGIPRGLVILYAAALILAVGWAAGRTTPGPDVDTLTREGAKTETAAKLELHRPAAYVPEGGWF